MMHESQITSHQSRAICVREAIAEAIAILGKAGVPSHALAAELLLMHVIGRDRAWLYAHSEEIVAPVEREQFFALVARRAAGEPTQYLTGSQEFWGLEFEVTRDVLIPRPETEHVVEVALARLGVLDEGDGARSPQHAVEWRIADLGTGSGCIAIALAHELPSARVIATDISAPALEVARRNAVRHGVAARIDFVECNLLDAFLHGSLNTGHRTLALDLIVSNPPYVPRSEAATLPREVREHEPEVALFASEDGTALYAPLIRQAAQMLRPGGWLVLELGHNSREHVLGKFNASDWENVSITNDLAGMPRVAAARRKVGRTAVSDYHVNQSLAAGS